MSFLDQGQSWLTGQVVLNGGRLVTITRGAASVSNVSVAVGDSNYSRRAQDAAGGIGVNFGDRDYLIPTATFLGLFGGTTPQKGDRIIEVIGGVSTVFEVLTPDDDSPHWRYSDIQRTLMRIHTKRVSA